MITSLTNRKVKQILQWQGKARERRKDGVFLAEGLKMFEEAPLDWIREVYVSETLWDRLEGERGEEIRDKLLRTGYEEVKSDVFNRMSDTLTPQGILTVLGQPVYELETLLKQESPLFVILEGLQDPGNLGTILRTAEGAGVNGVIMSRDTVDLFNPKTIRATMGSVYRVPFLYVESLPELLQRLHEAGVTTYAAHLQGKEYYSGFSFREPTAFLIGNEGNGLREETAKCASYYLKIPMEGKLESLNAAVAAALLMYEAHRQRHLVYEAHRQRQE